MPLNRAAEDIVYPLKVDYYLDNFITLLDYVSLRYQSLLSVREKHFADLLKSLSLDAARLYVRLILRIGPYFRQDKIHYNEIINLPRAIGELKENGLLLVNEKFPIDDMLHCLTRPELNSLCQTLEISITIKQLKKRELILLLIKDYSDVIEKYLKQHFTFLSPIRKEIVQIYRLLFFGNLYQDMSEFILEDIGMLKFEKYQIRDQDRLFQSRRIVDQTLRLLNLNEELSQVMEDRQTTKVLVILNTISSMPVTHPNLLRRKQKSLLNGARYLERVKEQQQALAFYRLTELPPSRERQVRILEKQGDDLIALKLLEDIKGNPIDDSEQEFVGIFSQKLNKKLNLPYRKRQQFKFARIPCTLTQKEGIRVEQLVLEYYQKQGWQGFFAENTLWNGMLGLYFWEVVFSSSAGAFFNPYQRGPKDLFGVEFYRNRQSLIDSKLSELKTKTDYKQEIVNTYKEKYLTANFLVNWKYLTGEQLKLALEYIPAQHLALIFEAMIKHLGANGSGFPDLFICREGQYKLIEVKGPGDQLQLSQKRWLKRFQHWDIPYAVNNVSWS